MMLLILFQDILILFSQNYFTTFGFFHNPIKIDIAATLPLDINKCGQEPCFWLV